VDNKTAFGGSRHPQYLPPNDARWFSRDKGINGLRLTYVGEGVITVAIGTVFSFIILFTTQKIHERLCEFAKFIKWLPRVNGLNRFLLVIFKTFCLIDFHNYCYD
jgi:hypothetical protein